MLIDHVIYGVSDLAAAAARLEREYGLRFMRGGKHPGGTINSVAPLEPPQYLELLAVEEATDEDTRQLQRRIEAGVTLLGWGIVDDDIDATAARVGFSPVAGSITTSEGTTGGWRVVFDPDDDGLPFFISYDEAPEQRLQRWQRRRRELGNEQFGGFTFVEVGGDRARFEEWLDGSRLPIRYAGGEPGLRAVGIAGPAAEIVLREGF